MHCAPAGMREGQGSRGKGRCWEPRVVGAPWLWNLSSTIAEGLKIIQLIESPHLTDGETEAQVGRMAWLKLPPPQVAPPPGLGVLRFASDLPSPAHFRRTWYPTTPTTLSVTEEAARAQVKGEVFATGLWGSPFPPAECSLPRERPPQSTRGHWLLPVVTRNTALGPRPAWSSKSLGA